MHCTSTQWDLSIFLFLLASIELSDYVSDKWAIDPKLLTWGQTVICVKAVKQSVHYKNFNVVGH
jgi:hypothetical protein